MSNYIDRYEIDRQYKKLKAEWYGTDEAISDLWTYKDVLHLLLTAIDACPTADVAEIRRGEWIPCELKDGKDMVDLGYLKCSQCGDFGFLNENNWGDWTGQTITPYCPTCGAKMKNG